MSGVGQEVSCRVFLNWSSNHCANLDRNHCRVCLNWSSKHCANLDRNHCHAFANPAAWLVGWRGLKSSQALRHPIPLCRRSNFWLQFRRRTDNTTTTPYSSSSLSPSWPSSDNCLVLDRFAMSDPRLPQQVILDIVYFCDIPKMPPLGASIDPRPD